MAWKILLSQEIMPEGRKLLEDAGHTIIDGRGFETADVLADMKAHQPDAIIVRITPITREVIESNPNLKVVVRHGAGFDALDVKACHDNGVQTLYAPVANSISVAETALLLILECSRNMTRLRKTWVDAYYEAKLKLRKTTGCPPTRAPVPLRFRRLVKRRKPPKIAGGLSVEAAGVVSPAGGQKSPA